MQVSDKFYQTYLMSRIFHTWCHTVRNEKEKQEIVFSETVLHSRIQSFIKVCSQKYSEIMLFTIIRKIVLATTLLIF